MATTPVASSPWVTIPGIHNLRLVCVSSPQLAPILYRSAAPLLLPESSHALLSATGVTHIYDLRSSHEISRMSTLQPTMPSIAGVTRVHAPVHTDKAWDPNTADSHWKSTLAGDMLSLYVSLLEEARENGAYAPIFRHVLERPGEKLLVHCTVGKDRTGAVVAVLLKLAGVGDDEVVREYVLTSLAMPEMRRLMEESGALTMFEKVPVEKREEAIGHVTGSKEETMRAFLGALQGEKFGGAEKYVMSCGFTEDEVRTIRDNLLLKKNDRLIDRVALVV